MSEDLPDPENRVVLHGDKIRLNYTENNPTGHKELVKRALSLMRGAGFKLNITKHFPVSVSHQCGTVRFGKDPTTAALDEYCRSYDHDNLFVVDSSFFPASAAVNPALTIAAMGIRVADHIAEA
jgi:choline dehydrogenase-like flavoprotein